MAKYYIVVISFSILALVYFTKFYVTDSPEKSQSHQNNKIVSDNNETTLKRSNDPSATTNSLNDVSQQDDFLSSKESYPHSPVTDYEDIINPKNEITLQLVEEISAAAKLTEGELKLVKGFAVSKLSEDNIAIEQLRNISSDEYNARLITTNPALLNQEEVTKRDELLALVESEVAKLKINRDSFEDAILNSLPQSKVRSIKDSAINLLTAERDRDISSLSEFILTQDIGITESQTRDINALRDSFLNDPVSSDIPFGLIFGDTTTLHSSPEYAEITYNL